MNRKFRKKLIEIGFDITGEFYTSTFKRHQEPWGITKEKLLKMNVDSLGCHLGVFLNQNGFDLIPKAERHDCL